MEIRPCEWQHRETETGTAGVNQNACLTQQDWALVSRGPEWLSDLGHDTGPLWHVLDMRSLDKVSSSPDLPELLVYTMRQGGREQAFG